MFEELRGLKDIFVKPDKEAQIKKFLHEYEFSNDKDATLDKWSRELKVRRGKLKVMAEKESIREQFSKG